MPPTPAPPAELRPLHHLVGWADGFFHESTTDGGEWRNPEGAEHAIVGFAVTPFTTEFQVGDESLRIAYAPQEGVLIAPRVPHTTIAFGRQRFAQCGLAPAFLRRIAAEMGQRHATPPEHFERRKFPADHRLMVLARLMRRELDYASGPTFVFESMAQALAEEILRHGPHRFPRRSVEGRRPAAGSLRRAEQLIRARLDEPLSLADIAAVAGTSPFHFARQFKAATGLAPHQFVVRARIELAASLLRAAPLRSLAEVAQRAGFADQSHLTRTFRRFLGRTPAAYAREQQR